MWRVEYMNADGEWCLFNRSTTEKAAREIASNSFLRTRYTDIRIREVKG
jgi:hypothetical protein